MACQVRTGLSYREWIRWSARLSVSLPLSLFVIWASPTASILSAVKPPPQEGRESRPLKLGRSIEREAKGGEAHSYDISVSADQYLRVIVDNRGIEVVVALFGPDGKRLVDAEHPDGAQGPTLVHWIAKESGIYRVEVRSNVKTAAAGRYEIRIEELRSAISQDRSRQEARTAHAEGSQFQDQGTAESLAKAKKKYEEALPHWRLAGDKKGEALTLNKLGEVYYYLGETRKALDAFSQELPVAQAAGDRRMEAAALTNIGLIHDELGNKQKALDYYNQALPIHRALGNRGGEADTLSNLAMVYESLGEKQEALNYLIRVLPIRRAVGDRGLEATTLLNLGFVYSSMGEKQEALDYYNQALSIARAVGDRRTEATVLSNIGNVYDALGEKQQALDYHNEALPIRRAIGDRSGEAYTLQNIGGVHVDLGNKHKALDYFNQALPIERATGDRRAEAVTLSNIGKVYEDLGDQKRALDYHNQALSLLKAIGDRDQEAATLSNIGAVYASKGDAQRALDYFNQALPIEQAIKDRQGEALTRFRIAFVKRNMGNLHEARSQIESALSNFEWLRARIGRQDLRSSYFSTVRRYFDFYIDLLMRLHKRSPLDGLDAVALHTSERARARSLMDLLRESHTDIRKGIDPVLLEREDTLQHLINAKAERQIRLLSREHTEEQAATAAREIDSLMTEYQQLQVKIRSTSPRYAALTQPQLLGLKEIQQQVLDSDTLLLEYSLGDERSYLWAVTPTSIKSYELPKRADIEATARQFYDLLTTRNQWIKGETAQQRRTRLAEASAQYPNVAARLSQMLLGQLASELGNKRILIVADGALQYVPFAALPEPAASKDGLVFRQPLIVNHEIVNSPSASTLSALRVELAGRKPALKAVAVLADPVFDKKDSRVKSASEDQASKAKTEGLARRMPVSDLEKSARDVGIDSAELSMPRLLFTRQEAAEIVNLVPIRERKRALDFEASKATATDEDLAQYRIVHFATHGLLNSHHPELSGIVLSLVDEHGKPVDGFLRLHEVYNLRLPAELVVLSACQTGLGKEIRGEGLVGLTRGFMYAGAARVMASLWKVDDEATAELMKAFYERVLKQGKRPTAALREAQIQMWKQKDWQHPYYWAAFIIEGEWR